MSILNNPIMRKLARNPSPSSSTWLDRLSRLRADTDAVETLLQLHRERLAIGHKLDALDGRTYAAKDVVAQVNALTKQINAATKELLP